MVIWMRDLQQRDGEPDYSAVPLQAGLGGDPWRVLVASVLLNRAARRQAETSLRAILSVWPARVDVAEADFDVLTALCRPCGLQQRRAKTIRRAARDWDSVDRLDQLYGVGPYVTDAVGLFCLGRRDLESGDRVLSDFVQNLYLQDKKNLV